ncbi:AAA domain-containing protein [Ferruginibacter sp. HRS2-29]|uniref:AAA domain-containing protein n=1 Tax=Ferruginibacter sp. HRS2-29 TaxID=2487334 RepID=UPI0020CEEB5B|nr:AAA domain-containing protein [Ferruginibacter sp. HRS2-29]MCP9752085.1 WGR domain-containing protein [Ferruginibacter sp. HRS2-29]
MDTKPQAFRDFLKNCFDIGNYSADDVIAFVLPVFEEVLSFHEAGLVAPFETPGSLFITNNQLDIEEKLAHAPQNALAKISAVSEKTDTESFTISGSIKLNVDLDTGQQEHEDLAIQTDTGKPIDQPVYVAGYNCYEIIAGHHDALTDIFCLGLILGSMSFGLDLYDPEELKLFVRYRSNPAAYNDRVHPALSKLITEMTELKRERRISDLYDIITRLRNYRNHIPDKQAELENLPGWVNKELTGKSQYILNKLRNRLFDTSRRNRLLYYKPNMRFVNLTVSSVPIVLHYQSIRPETLFTWNNEIASKVTGMKDILLNKYLRFEDHLYLSASLDKIRVEAQRDVQEYGFSQLKMVASFLNWHNLKEDKNERIQSPLLLFPVTLKKNKKLKEDHYVVTVMDNVAEVNPVLANYLSELYGIRLPDFVDLDEMSMNQFYETIRQQIESAGQGIRLNYINKPMIRLVHSVAKQAVSNYKKRLNRSGGQFDSYRNIHYSYQPNHYKPLGLEIFRQRVEPRSSLPEFLVNENMDISSHRLTGTEGTKERQLFELTGSEENPYSWDFDVCNMVLGNFNYKKMSLVRDYNYVIDHKVEHAVFEKLFSALPKQQSESVFNLNDPADWYHVIAADPTQTKAILQGRTGESYIIQGPPGTGKSQTITNLVADFTARGKSVLFVCEKRAALDVVYHRLKQQQLDELCCYIHDSRQDKRAFIKNLKDTYSDFIRNTISLNEISLKRNIQLQHLQEQISLLEQFHSANKNIATEAGLPVITLIGRLVEIKKNILPLSSVERERIPQYQEWLRFGHIIKELSAALEETGAEPAFADHPFSKLNDKLFVAERPYELLETLTKDIHISLEKLSAFLSEKNIASNHAEKIGQVKNLIQDAVLLQPLAETDNLSLVDSKSEKGRQFNNELRSLAQLEKNLEQAKNTNINWRQKFSEQDADAALAIAVEKEHSFFRFFSSSWRKLKRQLDECYAFNQHQVKPAYSKILKQLREEFSLSDSVASEKLRLQQVYKTDNIDLTYVSVEMLRSKQGDEEIDYLLQREDANSLVVQLSRFNNNLYELEKKLQQFFNSYTEKTVVQLSDELESISASVEGLKELLPALRLFATLPTALKEMLSTIALSPAEAEATMADKSLQTFFAGNKNFANADMALLEKTVSELGTGYKKLLKLNAALIRAKQRKKFLDNVELSNMAISQLDAEQRQFKKNYNEGRKILENEFSKSMRYKSIRELTAKESGLVLKDLKPIWLMSPLSVSDSLPVDTSFFDIIIFDEASQITLEEGIPALYRAPQTVIVGDDKQMPPSNFFTAKGDDPDDVDNNDENDEILSSDTDSLLVQGSKKLDSVMLGWHYRSRYETLISYSNHAFYDGGLLTIPDKKIHDTPKPLIESFSAQDAAQNTDAIFDRSMSFHFHPAGIYEKRSNLDEANYIAEMIREMLKRDTRESIGIVAFSQEQQHTIEDALTRLANEDKHFEQQLEENYNRTEEGQYIGLFVKNLENVQGDERDIIIISVCYGFDAKKKMIMNFGPINKKGGEKRLNVIFSRAKKHMAVVSSIKHFNITNEYNEGASYFKRFLQYAELVSNGNMQMARVVLDGLMLKKENTRPATPLPATLNSISEQLVKNGYHVTANVGQSGFKCSLAVKLDPADDNYTLSILLDDEQFYSADNIVEQYYQRPEILKSFGWKMIFISSKDWLLQPQVVMSQIVKKLTEKIIEETEQEEANVSLPGNNPVSTVEDGGKLFIQEGAGISSGLYNDLHFRRLTYTDEASNKFWEVATDGHKLIIRYGKTGTKGQVQVKTFADFAAADKEKERLIKEKTNKGYR